jgi:long-chain acyl-CoA synthetase
MGGVKMEERKWYKSYPPGMSKSIEIEKITMPQFFTRAAKMYPNRTALQFMGKEITFKDFEKSVNRFANALVEIGVKAGDRVALLMPNIPQIAIAYYGIWRMGGVPVPNNPLYTDRELEYQFNDSGSTALVTLDLFVPRMLALRPKTKIRTIISAHINDYLPFPKKQLFPILKKGMHIKYEKAQDYYQFKDLIRGASSKFTGPPPDWNDLASIFYTGGTTGVSKGVIMPHSCVSSMTQILKAYLFDLEEKEAEKVLAIYPFFHVAGFTAVMNLCVLKSWTAILIPRPEPQAVLNMMVKYRPTLVPAVPTIYVGLLGLPDFKKHDFSFIKGFLTGAAPMAQDTVRELEEATGIDTSESTTIVEAYGMTEFAIASIVPWKGKLKLGSVGIPLPNTDVKIVDLSEGKKEMPVGEEGEIICRGPQMCSGYYNRPEETNNSIRNGWFYSGDIGKMDEDGYLYIVERKKDMILAGGYNIYPREIDEVLFEHPKILEACAVGISDKYRGETVKAFVVLKPGETITEEELDAYCRKSLAAYKVPRIYEFTESLPKSAVGKILRRELLKMEEGKADK